MKIVHTASSPGWGAAEVRILAEAQGLLRRGHDVRLLCPGESRIFVESRNWKVAAIPLPIGKKRPAGVNALLEWYRSNRCDVVNTHDSTDAWLTALTLLVLGRPFPMVHTRHTSAPVSLSGPTRWLYLRATSRIVTTCERLKKDLVERNRFPERRIDVVPTWLDGESPGSYQAMLDDMERIYREAAGRPRISAG